MSLVLAGVAHTFLTDRGEAVEALAPTDLVIEEGEFVCLVGPSGCGKTTLLNIVAGFLRPTAGTAAVEGAPIVGPAPERGVVFQQPNLFPWLTVGKNVELGLRFRGVDRATRASIAAEQLSLVGLDGFADAKPYELSGGMQQRAQIARVLANDPSYILMDEPFGALDALTRERLQADLRALSRARGKTVLFITHSVDEAVYLGDRVLVMSHRPGRVVRDQRIDLPDPAPAGDLRAAAEFAALRDSLAASIGRAD